jgi:pimeloyl-ACP methyl ester carboxylesterase
LAIFGRDFHFTPLKNNKIHRQVFFFFSSFRMGQLFSKRPIEQRAFQPPRHMQYDVGHPNLNFLGSDEHDKEIPLMSYYVSGATHVILYSHGNAVTIGGTHDFLHKLASDSGMCVVTYDYPGYGLAAGNTATEKNCHTTIERVYAFLCETWKPKNIIVYGSSIGTGPTANLAANHPDIGLCVLQSPFTSTVVVAHRLLEMVCDVSEQTSCLELNVFPTYKIIQHIACKVVLLHGTKDALIPFSCSERLYAARLRVNKPSVLIPVPNATHNNIETKEYNEFILQALACVH